MKNKKLIFIFKGKAKDLVFAIKEVQNYGYDRIWRG